MCVYVCGRRRREDAHDERRALCEMGKDSEGGLEISKGGRDVDGVE